MKDLLGRWGRSNGWALVACSAAWIALAACGNTETPAGSAADATTVADTAADSAADSAADTGSDAGSGDSAADSAAADSAADSLADSGKEAGAADAAADSVADGGTDAAATDAATADAVADSTTDATSADIAAADVKDTLGDAGLCPLPQPPGTVCQGSTWMCAPGYFHGFGTTDCWEATCDNMAKVLGESINAAVAKSHTCAAGEQDECVVVSTSTACQGTCGMAVNSGMANDVALVVGWVDDHICKEFGYAAKCGYSTPKCMAPKPFCNGGTCAYAP